MPRGIPEDRVSLKVPLTPEELALVKKAARLMNLTPKLWAEYTLAGISSETIRRIEMSHRKAGPKR